MPAAPQVSHACYASPTLPNSDFACIAAPGPNGHYYTVVNVALNWFDAKNAAAATVYNGMQGHLVTISNQAENDYVASLISSNYVWLGMYRSTYDVWVWETDFVHPAINPTFWTSGEPSYGGEYCTQMDSGGVKTWGDRVCTNERYYVIEYEPKPMFVDKCPSKFDLQLLH